MQLIMLIDMDYFYAACEELRHPEVKEKPVVVGSDPKQGQGRGVVMTANYTARKFGLRSAMPISQAYKLKSDAIYFPADFDYYEKMSKEVMTIAKGYADKFEQVSIDEAYLDVSKKVDTYEEAEKYAKKIKDEIKEKVGLPCSIGVSTNKLMAKMISDAAKPNGVKVIKEEDAKAFLKDMPVGKLYGIGNKTAEKLKTMGYETVGQLAESNIQELREQLGVFGVELHKSANGIDESKVTENYDPKSIGRELTFEKDVDDPKQIFDAIKRLSEEVIKDVNRQGLSFKVITLKLRYNDFTEHLKSRSIRYSDNIKEVVDTAKSLYQLSVYREKKVRKIGVRVSGLIKYRGQKKMGDFFETVKPERNT